MELSKKIQELKDTGFFKNLIIERGIEKESLRVSSNGSISEKSHPASLGSSFTNSSITTDFAEALVEIVTPVFNDIDELYDHLFALHVFINNNIGDELLWPFSIPPKIDNESKINIATYSNNNEGQLKHVYRKGLAARYGKTMQCVSGIHFNFSLSEDSMKDLIGSTSKEDVNSTYLNLIRNFKRIFWFVLSEFGESAVIDKTFVKGRKNDLDELNDTDLYKENATSLRMSEIGYKSPAQESMNIHYNDLDSFLEELRNGIVKPYPEFSALGLKDNDGSYKQISDGILQIENELYDCIRPKRAAQGNERPYDVLKNHGIKYVEVRGIDLSPYEITGISKNQIRILDLVLLYCLIEESPKINDLELESINRNDQAVIKNGRDLDTKILYKKNEASLRDARNNIMQDLQMIAEQMKDKEYEIALKDLKIKTNTFDRSKSFHETGIEIAKDNHSKMLNMPEIDTRTFQQQAKDSLKKFDTIHNNTIDEINNFLASYNSNL